jgi:hypothetical protein
VRVDETVWKKRIGQSLCTRLGMMEVINAQEGEERTAEKGEETNLRM